MNVLAAMVEGLKARSLQLVADVSNAQGVVDWQAVAATNVHGALIKGSEGRTFIDAYHAQNRAGAARAKIHAGLYHFARPDLNGPEEEADHFAGVIGQLHPFELVPALDLEVAGHTGANDAVSWARQFSRRLHEHLGVFPLFYSNPWFIGQMFEQAASGHISGRGSVPTDTKTPIGGGLWLASYGRNDGRDYGYQVPPPWRKARLHQFTSRGRLAGVRGFVDLSHTDSLPLVGHAAAK